MTDDYLQEFYRILPGDEPAVLEVGTRRWDASRPTTHKAELLACRPGADHIGLDMLAGDDVDVVADAHDLPFADQSFAGIICYATLEHLRRPWLAAAEFSRVLLPGGLIVVQTHQSYPVHGYPHDYFRFSDKALRELFAPDGGWKMLAVRMRYPAKVIPVHNAVHQVGLWNFEAEAFLNSECLAERLP